VTQPFVGSYCWDTSFPAVSISMNGACSGNPNYLGVPGGTIFCCPANYTIASPLNSNLTCVPSNSITPTNQTMSPQPQASSIQYCGGIINGEQNINPLGSHNMGVSTIGIRFTDLFVLQLVIVLSLK